MQVLKNLEINPTWILTKPPSKSGRGLKLNSNPVMKYAADKNWKCCTSIEKVNNVDLLLVVSYGNIIPDEMLNCKFGCLNLHPSFLPRYRGATPIQRAIMSGDREVGVSWIKLTSDLDAGPILCQDKVLVNYQDKNENYDSIKMKIAESGSDLINKHLEQYINSELKLTEQFGETTWANRITKEERVIDLNRTAKQCNNLIKALDPYPGARCKFNNEWITFKKSSFSLTQNINPGEVELKGNSLVVGTSKGILLIDTITPQGKRPMSGRDFLNSRPNAKFS
ncbi:hypothetical protein CL645_04485 [bacterium]|nr:hypothetical protein [bacterium]